MKALVRLPPKLSNDELVLNFFELRLEDLDDPRQDSMVVCVLERDRQTERERGREEERERVVRINKAFSMAYSKAERGKAVKTTGLTTDIEEISGPMVLERYIAVADYEPQKKTECSLRAGQMVEIIDKNQNGWWFVSLDDFHEGWVPATFLDPLYGTEEAQVEEFARGQGRYTIADTVHVYII